MKSIRIKLLIGVLFIIVILSVTSVSIFMMHLYIVDKYKTISNNLIIEYKLMSTTSDLIDAYNTEYRDPNKQNEIAVTQAESKIQAYIKFLDLAIVNKESIADYIGFKNIITEIVNHVNLGLRDISAGNSTNVTTHYDEAKLEYDYAKQDGTLLIIDELKYSESLQNQINLFYQTSLFLGGLVIIFTGLGSIIFIFIFSRKIVNPILKLRITAEKISKGDTGVIIDEKLMHQGDEIGNLANSISIMVKQLNEKISSESQEKDKIELLLTNSQKLQKELEQEKNRISAIIESMGESLFVLDKDLKVILINSAAKRLLEVNGQQVIGTSIKNLAPNILKDGKELLSSERPTSLTLTGVSLEIGVNDNYALRLPSGKEFPIAITTTPLRGENDNVIGVVTIFRDVTVEKQSRSVIEQTVIERTKELLDKNTALLDAKEEINRGWEQIKLEKTQLLASINSLTVGFVMFDVKGNVLYINTAFNKLIDNKQQYKSVIDIDSTFGTAFSIKQKFDQCIAEEKKIEVNEILINGKNYKLFMSPIYSMDNSYTLIGVVLLVED